MKFVSSDKHLALALTAASFVPSLAETAFCAEKEIHGKGRQNDITCSSRELSHNPATPQLHPLYDRTLPPCSRKTLNRLLGPQMNGGIEIVYLTEKADQSGMAQEPFSLMCFSRPRASLAVAELSADFFRQRRYRPCFVEGRIMEIRVRCRRPGLNLQNSPRELAVSRDCYGNLMTLDKRLPDTVSLSIKPKLPFAREEILNGDLHEVALDLSALQLEVLSGLFFTKAETPVCFIGADNAYGVYSNMPQQLLGERFKPYAEEVSRVLFKVESFFGFKPASLIQNVYVVHGFEFDGFFHRGWPNTVVLCSEDLDTTEALAPLAAHEALHSIIEQLGLSNGLLAKFYWQFSGEETFPVLCRELNERNFLQSGAIGHSHDNSHEFAATFLNSLIGLSPAAWKVKMHKQAPAFRAAYLQAGYRLQEDLEMLADQKRISSQAPAFRYMRAALEFLEDIDG